MRDDTCNAKPPTYLKHFQPIAIHLLLHRLLLLRRQRRAQVRRHFALEFHVRRLRPLLDGLELLSSLANFLVIVHQRLELDRLVGLPTRLPRGRHRLGPALRQALGGRLPCRGGELLLDVVEAEFLEARLVAGDLFLPEQLVIRLSLRLGHGDNELVLRCMGLDGSGEDRWPALGEGNRSIQ